MNIRIHGTRRAFYYPVMEICFKSCKSFEQTRAAVLSLHRSILIPDQTTYYLRADGALNSFSRLAEYFESHPLESPSSPTHNPLSWAFDMEGQDWAAITARTPENLEKFNRSMNVSTPQFLHQKAT